MSSTKSRIAVAAALAALSVPAFASDPATCSVCADPTFPAVERLAPAVSLGARGGEAEALRADPTWPGAASVAPGIRLTPYLAGGPVFGPADRPTPDTVRETAPNVHYAVVLGGKAERVTASR